MPSPWTTRILQSLALNPGLNGRRRKRMRGRGAVSVHVERLEERLVLSLSNPAWVELGPGPTNDKFGGGGGINTGAAQAVDVLPGSPGTAVLASVSGGVWRTSNFTATTPTWVTLMDSAKYLYTSTVTFDPLDATGNTVYAGLGQFTSLNTSTSDTNFPAGAGTGYYKITNAFSATPVVTLNPITDPDAGALKGIALTAVDTTRGKWQFTLVASPAATDFQDVDAAGAISNTSALLLPTTASVRFVTTLIPHHDVGAPFLPLESKLDTGITFRAWDQTTGTAGGRADTSTNGGTTAFSTATETAATFFEARLFRSFNTVASLNYYTLEAEFNAITGNPLIVDRATSAFTGFTILMSPSPGVPTVPLYRLYYGIQFNANGTETDMGYRYLTTSEAEAAFLEGLGPADKRAQRDGTYFRELGVNKGTAILGYIYSSTQPGTSEMKQVYRLDEVDKPTRQGTTQVAPVKQQNGDHVYTTKVAVEMAKTGTWREEASRGFVRELSPTASIVAPAVVAAATSAPVLTEEISSASSPIAINANSGSGLLGLIALGDGDALPAQSGPSDALDSASSAAVSTEPDFDPEAAPDAKTLDSLLAQWDEWADVLP